MAKFIVRRLLLAVPVLIGLSIVLFAFVHLLPGDPATAILGQHATPDRVAEGRPVVGVAPAASVARRPLALPRPRSRFADGLTLRT